MGVFSKAKEKAKGSITSGGTNLNPFSGASFISDFLPPTMRTMLTGESNATADPTFTAKEAGVGMALSGAAAVQAKLNVLLGMLSTSTAGADLAKFSSLESFKGIGSDLLNGVTPGFTNSFSGGSDMKKFFTEGFGSAAKPEVDKLLTAMFPAVEGRINAINTAKAGSGRSGTILTGRQNILG